MGHGQGQKEKLIERQALVPGTLPSAQTLGLLGRQIVRRRVQARQGLAQGREFARAAGVTGLVLTKLDGTAKGGIAVAVVRELGVPIRYVGVGESLEDLVPFDAAAFAEGLIG